MVSLAAHIPLQLRIAERKRNMSPRMKDISSLFFCFVFYLFFSHRVHAQTSIINSSLLLATLKEIRKKRSDYYPPTIYYTYMLYRGGHLYVCPRLVSRCICSSRVDPSSSMSQSISFFFLFPSISFIWAKLTILYIFFFVFLLILRPLRTFFVIPSCEKNNNKSSVCAGLFQNLFIKWEMAGLAFPFIFPWSSSECVQ